MHTNRGDEPKPEERQVFSASDQADTPLPTTSESGIPSSTDSQTHQPSPAPELVKRREELMERLATGNRTLERLENAGALGQGYSQSLDDWTRALLEYQEVDDRLRAWLEEEQTSKP